MSPGPGLFRPPPNCLPGPLGGTGAVIGRFGVALRNNISGARRSRATLSHEDQTCQDEPD